MKRNSYSSFEADNTEPPHEIVPPRAALRKVTEIRAIRADPVDVAKRPLVPRPFGYETIEMPKVFLGFRRKNDLMRHFLEFLTCTL